MAFRNPQGIHRLSAAAIKYINDPGWHADGGGLYLEVDRAAASAGPCASPSMASAATSGWSCAQAVARLMRASAPPTTAKSNRGIDPVADKRRDLSRRERAIPTFEEASRKVHEQRRGDVEQRQACRSMDQHVARSRLPDHWHQARQRDRHA